MKLFLIASPIFLLGFIVIVRTLRGRPLSRPDLSAWVALLLLAYTLATAGIGLFWVAKMALPKLDMHYLLGYCMILLVGWHLVLQLRVLEAFLRRNSPAVLLAADRRTFRPAIKRAATVLLGLALLTPLVWVAALELGAPARAMATGNTPESTNGTTVTTNDKSTIWITRGSRRQPAIEYLYEQAAETRQKPLSRALSLLRLRKRATVSAPPACKELPDAAKLQLTEPASIAGMSLHDAMLGNVVEPAETSEQRGKPTLQLISQLLHYANGVTSSRAEAPSHWLRAAPSAGARYPTDVYVMVSRVEGIEPGIYYFNPHARSLSRIKGAEAPERISTLMSTGEAFRRAPVSFIIGATFDRTTSRYDTHSFRYVTIDSGHVAANLRLAAEASGLHCTIEPMFDDEALTAALGANINDEGTLLALACAPGARNRAGVSGGVLNVPQHTELTSDDDLDLIELTRLSQRLTSWHLAPGAPVRQVSFEALTRDAGRPLTALPVAEPVEVDVFRAIGQRRSFREFTEREVSLAVAAGVLRDAFSLAATTRGHSLLELYVAVSHVNGLNPGVYRYLPEPHALELVRAGDASRALEVASYSQGVLGQAALVLLWAMRTRVAERLDGVRGYRHALLDAGLAGEHAYLSASARGLGICGVGAFQNDGIDSLVERQTKGHLALYLMGVGHRH